MSEKNLIWSATPTPFTPSGSLDRRSIARLIEHHVELGVGGLLVGGTCGEGAFMTNSQRVSAVQLMKEAAGDRLHIAAHVTDTSAARVIDNLQRMTREGADSVVVAPPFLVADFCTKAFLRRYFLEPAEAAKKPVGLYLRTPLSRMELSLELWDELLAHPNVRFVKDSTGSAEYVQHLAALKARRPELTVLTGNEFDVVSAVAAGYDGCLMGTGCLNARLIRRALDALSTGDRAEADAWQARSNAFLRDLFRPDISGWMAGLKYALRHCGLFGSEFSHLAFPITDEDRARIDAALAREREFWATGHTTG